MYSGLFSFFEDACKWSERARSTSVDFSQSAVSVPSSGRRRASAYAIGGLQGLCTCLLEGSKNPFYNEYEFLSRGCDVAEEGWLVVG